MMTGDWMAQGKIKYFNGKVEEGDFKNSLLHGQGKCRILMDPKQKVNSRMVVKWQGEMTDALGIHYEGFLKIASSMAREKSPMLMGKLKMENFLTMYLLKGRKPFQMESYWKEILMKAS